MCLDVCDRFIWFMDAVNKGIFYLDDRLVNTEARFRRSRHSALKYQGSISLHKRLCICRKELLSNENEELT
jgi:hypothetical protein